MDANEQISKQIKIWTQIMRLINMDGNKMNNYMDQQTNNNIDKQIKVSVY